ncbi:hypothetical protein ENSA5_13980 [Enhygromyxa salina]|uniref:Uncharacterized protein n=1 Tax=Enhygromyxa salina TaxID=215803 RepID=A0A2S9YEW7_9BACT|nr:hypothetical protein [Enhygromyxa salina]PRQ03643.1 hypothetical protein ENSA5_13980 [Enhygromyxa salina]
MLGTYVIVGASLLGAASCLLIAWSLWTRSQARRRGRRPPLTGGQQQGLPASADDFGEADEPRTQFMSEAELFGATGSGSPPTQMLTESAHQDTQIMSSGSSGSPRTQILTEPTHELDPGEVQTEFLSADELFPDEAEPKTAFMTEEELFAAGGGVDDDDDDADEEPELATEFLSSEELYGAQPSEPSDARTVVESAPTPRVEETVVLAEGAVLDGVSRAAADEPDEGHALDDGFAVAPPRHQHLDRPPVHRIPVAPPSPSPAPPRAPVARAPARPAPARPAATPQAPTPPAAKPPTPTPPPPVATPPAPSPRASAPATPKKTPPSRLPASRRVATPPPRTPVRPAPPKEPVVEADAPQVQPHPVSAGYVGFVGAPLDDDDDDDDDDDLDGDDPETEMVHQAELLRLMGRLGDKAPGGEGS